MKLQLLFSVHILLLSAVNAQIPPAAFTYSAVARNAQNNPLANTTIGIQISILKTTPSGTVVYSENHFASTDLFGLFNIVVGAGAVQSGSMSNIDWSNDKYYLKVGMDANGGNNFLTMGTTQLLSVPYALYAKSAGSISGGGSGGGTVIGTPIFTQGNGVTDIEGNQYPTIKLGNQEWIAINLKTSKFRNGDAIPLVSDSTQWAAIWNGGNPTGAPAWCYYNNNSANNAVYGKLYNWYAIADQRNVCPNGWHVPSDAEWNQLINFIDPYNTNSGQSSDYAGGAMKTTGTLQNRQGLWNHPNNEATNVSGFAGTPGGVRGLSFGNIGTEGHWWSSTESIPSFTAFYRSLVYGSGTILRGGPAGGAKSTGYSVRCIKD
jgi:uncharacterized protein (TIGR02145 family)